MTRIKIFLLVVFVIVAAAIIAVVVLNSGNDAPDVYLATSGQETTLAQKKAEILSQVRGGNRVLSKEEKGAIIEQLSGEAFMEYQFTYDEEVIIVEALNR